MIRIILFLLVATIPMSAICEELVITPITEGDPAPHSGVILDSKTAAKIIVDKKLADERCSIEKVAAVRRGQAECEFKKSLLEAEKSAEQKKLEILLSSQERENERLHTALEDSESVNGVWWFVTGTVTGIVASIAIFYAAVKTAE